ncbi:lipopolysaccharide assembly protein LapB [Piscinibacter sakaiensis]|uniref:Lipopolysaccharide assembly protein B n=1 Tax=Piscinibacter sakaiensis TaxID=1547922 RepID=A0A0K8NTJ6_PISS1|nr:lipopolysaccharide assembly protein LapB [Piscinibacter sakaiensis]GAP33609.1 heat shock protein YciM, precursor [Piscinibacter sakaiensis]
MDFDLQWLLLALPAVFGLGWLASRFDLRQWRRERRDSPRAYFKGLNLLLNEQQDKAIDAFIEAVQQDPDTTELHFALGNLFRRRGEYERAVRVHEHLLGRADLPRSERDRARHALAQDFMSAGLFDRAEQAWSGLEGSAFDTEARLALLTLHERSRNWRAAVETAQKLERTGTGSYASRVAHFWCELAEEADARQAPDEAADALRRAREAAPLAPRPLVLAGRRALRQGDPAAAMQHWAGLLATQSPAFGLVAEDHARCALATGQAGAALEALRTQLERGPTMDLLRALAVLDPADEAQRERLRRRLAQQPTLSAARALLALLPPLGEAEQPGDRALLDQALGDAARPLQRYRCAACGFEAQHYFWQCPGCLNWDTYPPVRLEDQ